MPDFDSGHIFLTTLAPIRESASDKQMHTSYTQAARIALAKLPTALQSPATQMTGVNSPFARNRRTHLARMFVLDDVVFNGRVGKNAIWAALTKDDPATPKPVDRLSTSYVVFCADIDAVTKDGDPLPEELSQDDQRRMRETYARMLWDTMEQELRSVYENCFGFETVKTANDFAAFLERCHVETTMPFHDYYIEPPSFHHLPVKALLVAVGAPVIFTLLALILRLFGVHQMPLLGLGTGVAMLIGLLFAAIIAFFAVRYVNRNGEKPLPPGRYDDLPSVLKALYLQQKFSDFVVDSQGVTPEDLHQQFGAFLDNHKPSDKHNPTQPPGVIAAATPHREGAK